MGNVETNTRNDVSDAENSSTQNYETIIMDADSPIDRSSMEKLYAQLHSGVYLNQKKQKYWIGKKSGRNYFMVFARGLTIAWGDDPTYWSWSAYKQQDGVDVEMAKLRGVCWFDVNGKLAMSLLSQGTRYEIVFIIKVDNDASGWTKPVCIEFHVQGIIHKKQLNQMIKPKGQWLELHVGEFDMSANVTGDVFFRIGGTESLQWKSGLHVKGVAIRPKIKINETIIMDADSPIDRSSTEKLYEQIHSGVYLNQKKQKYWIDKKFGLSYFMVFSRSLSVAWGDDPRYWSWSAYKQQDGVEVEMAEVTGVCWFDVNGKLDVSLLSQGTRYEIVFIVKLNNNAKGWRSPVCIEIHVQGIVHKKQLNLMTEPQEQWIELHVGEFDMSTDVTGDVFFRISETEVGQSKYGFVVKGVVVRPKKKV